MLTASKYLHWGHMSKFSLLTPLTPHTWVHMSTVFRVTKPYKVHKSTFIRVTPSQSLLGMTPSQTWDLESHVHCLQGNPTSQTLHLGSHVHSLLDDIPPRLCTWDHISSFQSNIPSQNLHVGSHVQFPECPHLTRIFTLGHMSTVSRVTLPHQNF